MLLGSPQHRKNDGQRIWRDELALYQAPRGTLDILPQAQKYWQRVEAAATRLCRLYGYQRIDTPVFEDTRLFVRSVGEGTDIVEKEMYTFADRSGDLLTLRPEGTAPVCRAYLEHGMRNLPQPVKLYYWAPIFRYERPQAGRYRQHHQFGCEAIGELDPAVDAEVIELAWQLFAILGLKGLHLYINSIGCPQCRPVFVERLTAHYASYRARLCADCQVRLERNPLRLLDCKKRSCQPYATSAPRSIDYLCPECRTHFEGLQNNLALRNLAFQVNHRLVRGLDYYTKTVFEIVPAHGGAQSTICGGGRYDGLMEALGGPPTPGVGFGSGVERIISNMQRQGVTVEDASLPKVFVAHQGEVGKQAAMSIARQLHQAGVGALYAFGNRSLRAQLRQASALGALWVIIVGEEELQSHTLTLRDMARSTQETIPTSEVVATLHGLLSP